MSARTTPAPLALTQSNAGNASIASMGSLLVWALVAGILALLAIPASAQQADYQALPIADTYKVAPLSPDADDDALKSHRSTYRNQLAAIRAGESQLEDLLRTGGNVANSPLKAYLTEYVFPAMTQLEPEVLSTLGEQRAKFLKDFLSEQVRGNARQSMIDVTLEATLAIAANNSLHPAARLNAVYLIGQLDDVAASRFDNQMPRPSARALTSLQQILTSNDDAAAPIYLKIAALAGIQRHLEVARAAGTQIDQGVQNAVVTQLNDNLGQPVDPANEAVSYWLKRRSAQMGGFIGNTQTITRLLDLLKDKTTPFWLQMDAMVALDRMGTQTITAEQNGEAARIVTEFLANALASEAKSTQKAVDELVFKNMLFGDLDLVVQGTNYEADAAAESGEGGGGGESESSSGGGKFSGGNGMGMGMGGPGEGFGGAGRGGPTVTVDNSKPKLELPNYELQSVRSRIKALAFYGGQTLGLTTDQGLRRYLDEDGEKFARKVVADLQDLLANSTIGIVDREEKKDGADSSGDEKPYTQQLIQLCQQSAEALREHVASYTGKPAAGAADTSAPAAGGDGLGGVNN